MEDTNLDIVMITRDRPELTEQCIRSMRENATDWSRHRLVVMFDGTDAEYVAYMTAYDIPAKLREHFGSGPSNTRFMSTEEQIGVGGAKNAGADWLKRRGPYADDVLMFSDNDLYYLPNWDESLPVMMTYGLPDVRWPNSKPKFQQLGGWRHPYHALGRRIMKGTKYTTHEVDAVTGNCFVMRWSDWLKYGPFDSSAIGPGQSEDYALSQRIRAGGGLVATLDPPVAIHCGLVNSIGEPATGWRECEQQITEQLAGLSAEMRESVLIMRPAPTAEPKTSWNGELYSTFGKLRVGPDTKLPDGRTATEAGLQPGPIVSSQYVPGSLPHRYLGTRKFAEDADRVFEDARTRLDMQPRDPSLDILKRYRDGKATIEDVMDVCPPMDPRDIIKPGGKGGIREITLDEAMKMYPHFDRTPRLQGCNAGSGQRRFETTTEVCWTNVDLVDRPPDQVPDVVGDARRLDIIFPPGSLDYVVSHHLHEHLGHGEADPITRAAYNVLRAGGSLLVFTPDARKLAGRWLGGELDDFQFAVQMMGAYQGEESDRHRWTYTQETLERSLADAAPWREVKPFDWRAIPGADLARDFYIAAVECVK